MLKTTIGEEKTLLAAIADGAGSASHSQIGSKEAVQHLLKVVLKAGIKIEDISREHACAWYNEVFEHIKEVAARESLPIADLACTLLLAVISKNRAVLVQIGDGAWVLEKDGALVAGTWPETGEYANVTIFLTTNGAIKSLQFQKIEGAITGVAGFTDGIQMLALDFARRTPGERFFTSMFGSLRVAKDETDLNAPLRELLASEVICSRTDDDKTLVLGVWSEPKLEAHSNQINLDDSTSPTTNFGNSEEISNPSELNHNGTSE